MRQFTFSIRGLLLLVVALGVEPLRCGIPTTESLAQELPPGVLITEGKTQQGFPYLSGGISTNEREAIERLAKNYNVKLSFAEKRGRYLSDVRVEIEGQKGAKITDITTNGPLFYIELPEGNYTITATYQGVPKRIKDLRVTKDKTINRTLTWDLGEQSEALRQR